MLKWGLRIGIGLIVLVALALAILAPSRTLRLTQVAITKTNGGFHVQLAVTNRSTRSVQAQGVDGTPAAIWGERLGPGTYRFTAPAATDKFEATIPPEDGRVFALFVPTNGPVMLSLSFKEPPRSIRTRLRGALGQAIPNGDKDLHSASVQIDLK